MTAVVLHRWRAVAGCGLGVISSAFAAEHTPSPCRIAAENLQIEARSEPDDGAWGPTLEISISDAIQPLARLIAPESRPIEACWWADIDRNAQRELIIGVGPNSSERAGAHIFTWDGQQLKPVPLPRLPSRAEGNYRYVVRRERLYALPVVADVPTIAQSFALHEGGWWSVESDPTRK